MLPSHQIDNYLQTLQSDGVSLSLAELVQYKGLSKAISLSPEKSITARLTGGDRSILKGRGMEFDEARVYQAGDDIRSIDWRVTARTGKPHTKLYREERERPVFLFIDQSASMQFGTHLLFKSVQAAHIASLIGFSAVARGDKVGAVIFNQQEDIESKPRSQNKAILSILNSLVTIQQSTQLPRKNPANTALQRLHYLVKPGSLVHLISDFAEFNSTHFDILGELSRHSELSANYIYDPLEVSLPDDVGKQQLHVTDGQRKKTILVGEQKINDDYEHRQKTKLEQLRSQFEKIKVPVRSISSALPISDQINVSNRNIVVGNML